MALAQLLYSIISHVMLLFFYHCHILLPVMPPKRMRADYMRRYVSAKRALHASDGHEEVYPGENGSQGKMKTVMFHITS